MKVPENDLNRRQKFVLVWLDGQGDGEFDGLATFLGDKLIAAGLSPPASEQRYGDTSNGTARAAANTLAALKRRGLATNDGGGAFLANRWKITDAGHELATQLRRHERRI